MENKTFYLAVFGNNQVPFKDLDSLIQYFIESGDLFSSILPEVKFYEMTIKPIDSPLNNSNNG